MVLKPSSESLFNKDLDIDSKESPSKGKDKGKQQVVSHMQDKLMRSRNAYNKLKKQNKKKKIADGEEEEEIEDLQLKLNSEAAAASI